MLKLILVVAYLSVLGSTAAAETSQEPDALKFYAYDWDGKGHIIDRSDVLCAILRAEGVVEVGRTNKGGEVVLSYAQLFKPGNMAVMFCADSTETACTSIRLDTGFLRGFAEYNVRVPPDELINRGPVRAKAKDATR